MKLISTKAKTKKLVFQGVVLAVLAWLSSGRATAQTFATLYSFEAGKTNSSGVFTNSNGANAYAGLTVAVNGNTRYGTTARGGSWGAGTIFAVNTDGTGFKALHEFDGTNGAKPWAGLILSSNTLYGTTNAGLALLGNALYGTASRGGSAGLGTVFAVNVAGTGFVILHTFTGGDGGSVPVAALVPSGEVLYGTASGGGTGRTGAVFAVKLDGTGFTILHSFDRSTGCSANLDCGPGEVCAGGVCSCKGFCGGDW